MTFSGVSATAALFAELGATTSLEDGTSAESCGQTPGQDRQLEATSAFAFLLDEALPSAKQFKGRGQGFAGRQSDAGVEAPTAAGVPTPVALATPIPPSGPPVELGLSLLQIVPAPSLASPAATATAPGGTPASGSASRGTRRPAASNPPIAAAPASSLQIPVKAGKPESPATMIAGEFPIQSSWQGGWAPVAQTTSLIGSGKPVGHVSAESPWQGGGAPLAQSTPSMSGNPPVQRVPAESPAQPTPPPAYSLPAPEPGIPAELPGPGAQTRPTPSPRWQTLAAATMDLAADRQPVRPDEPAPDPAPSAPAGLRATQIESVAREAGSRQPEVPEPAAMAKPIPGSTVAPNLPETPAESASSERWPAPRAEAILAPRIIYSAPVGVEGLPAPSPEASAPQPSALSPAATPVPGDTAPLSPQEHGRDRAPAAPAGLRTAPVEPAARGAAANQAVLPEPGVVAKTVPQSAPTPDLPETPEKTASSRRQPAPRAEIPPALSREAPAPERQALPSASIPLPGDGQPLRPQERGPDRAPAAPAGLRTAPAEPVAREAAANQAVLPEPAAMANPALQPTPTPNLPETPEKTVSSGTQPAPRAEAPLAARYVGPASGSAEIPPALSREAPAPERQALSSASIPLPGDGQPLRPQERGPDRAPAAPAELGTAQIELVARQAVTDRPSLAGPPAVAKPAPQPAAAPNLPDAPEEAASSGIRPASRSEVAFAAGVVERAPASVEVRPALAPEALAAERQTLAPMATVLPGNEQRVRPEERESDRTPARPTESRTAPVEPVARETVASLPEVSEPAAVAKPSPPAGAASLLKTPGETPSSGARQPAPRAEVAFAARIVERAQATADLRSEASIESSAPSDPAARTASSDESSRTPAPLRPAGPATGTQTPEPALADARPGLSPSNPEVPAVERPTAEEKPAETVWKDRQPVLRPAPAAAPHTSNAPAEQREAVPEKWLKPDSPGQTALRPEAVRTGNQALPPRQASPAAAAREMAAEQEPASSTTRVPVRELRLQVPEAGREAGVEIRVRDQANEVNVSVRTRSPELAQSLRQALPDLVDRLGQRGLEAQVWRPAGSDVRVPAGERSLEVREADLGGNSPNQDGAGRGQAGSEGQQQQHPDDSQPGWTEEWARNFGAPPDARDRSEWQWLPR